VKVWILNLASRPIKISRPFAIGNLGLLIVVFIFFLQPTITSWLSARRLLEGQQELYDIYTRQTQYHDLLQQVEPTRNILPYAELTEEMENIRVLANKYGLTLAHFNAEEPINTDIDGGRFVALSVAVTVHGLPDSCADFIAALAQSPAFVQNVRMNFDGHGMVLLRVEFSLFGICE